MTKIKQAFLLLSDKSDSKLIKNFDALQKATQDYGDVFLLYHQKEDVNLENIENINKFVFTNDILTKSNYLPLGYSLVPGNNHYPLLQFYLENPQYDHYWCIEDDVFFSGNWMDFFHDFTQIESDFISSYITLATKDPNWYWWRAIANPDQIIPFEDRVRSFNPIYRISRKATEFLHKALLSGWCGHHEVLIPSLLYNAGFDLIDFGGIGDFVTEGFENKYYIDEKTQNQEPTMRFRPVFNTIEESLLNKLYHPVK